MILSEKLEIGTRFIYQNWQGGEIFEAKLLEYSPTKEYIKIETDCKTWQERKTFRIIEILKAE